MEKLFFKMLNEKVKEYSHSNNSIQTVPGDLQQFVNWCEVNLPDVWQEKMDHLQEIENKKLGEYHQKIDNLFTILEKDVKIDVLTDILYNLNYETYEADGYKEKLEKYKDIIRENLNLIKEFGILK